MRIFKVIFVILIGLFFILTIGCQEKKDEESGIKRALNEKYDMVQNGARLVLTYDANSKSFVGTVENITDKKLEKVKVEVHLSNGIEIGPTTPVDLEAGKKLNIKLTTNSEGFESWTAYPKVGGE
jgi:hypothetical protein